MPAQFLDAIDWHRPWLQPFRATAESLLQTENWRLALNAAASAKDLHNHCGLPIRFVPQEDLPPQTAYEAFISKTGCVPTRENLHDFFNALVWLSFPKIKVQLNALQAAEIEKANDNVQNGSRGKVRDAATLFDENTALLIVRDNEWLDAFRTHRWHEVFIERRETFRQNCEVWLFGHALMDKLTAPYKAITAHAWPLVADPAFFEMSFHDKRCWLDDTVASQLESGVVTSDFTPLPILGIPNWWTGQDDAFYADTAVFRPRRTRK